MAYTITTNDGFIKIRYSGDVTVPNISVSPTDYYKIFVPYSGLEYKVFAIRNRGNNRDRNNFQKEHNGREDYYYFKDNGDIVYKGGDKTFFLK